MHDLIVVGGGSAGCALAGRLAEAGTRRVLLLEAGQPAEAHPETLRSDGYRAAFVNDALMWERDSVPQPALGGRRVFVGSGRGMGGSGSINAMVYTRGSAADYAAWQLDGWDWDALVPDFEALEARLGLDRHPPSRFAEACIEAACESGFRREDDLNAGRLDGVLGYEWMNFQGDRRRSSYATFVAGARPEHLEVRTGVTVHRVELDPHTRAATAVVYADAHAPGQTRRAALRPGGSVVLCAGALETPRLLMLSGVGPGSVLQRLEVPVVVDAPEVGRNLQDHPNVTLFCHGASEVDATSPQVYGFHRASPRSALPPDQADTCYVCYPARSSFREGLIRMLPAMALPDALRHRAGVVRGVRAGVEQLFERAAVQRFVEHMWGLVVILGKPVSRGTVRPSSPQPGAPLHIDPQYFADPRDMDTMIRAIELARRITRAPALRPFYGRELMPGAWARSRSALEAFVRRNAMTTYHYGGTARMGHDALAPVDARTFEVRGTTGLRVADASVMPIVPVSALNAPSMLIGWRAADAIAAG